LGRLSGTTAAFEGAFLKLAPPSLVKKWLMHYRKLGSLLIKVLPYPRVDDRKTKTMINCETVGQSYFHLQDGLPKDLDVVGFQSAFEYSMTNRSSCERLFARLCQAYASAVRTCGQSNKGGVIYR